MMRRHIPFQIAAILFSLLLCAVPFDRTKGQYNVPFSSGPIPLCDTSTFTANVVGVGSLAPLNQGYWGMYSLSALTIDIITDHPQTLQISLTSPEGTTLLLSAFNGAGGQNYTNTTFTYDLYPSITTGTAPFSGNFLAQGGSLSVFDWENADGTWTITVIDTACAVTGPGPGGGPYTEGWFNGTATGGFAFAFDAPPPPECWGWVDNGSATICGGSFDVFDYYMQQNSDYFYIISDQNWVPVPDVTAISVPGTYYIDAYDQWGCWYWATFELIMQPPVSLGPDTTIDICNSTGPTDLTALFNLGNAPSAWSYNGVPITSAQASSASAAGIYQLIGGQGNCSDTAVVTLDLLSGPSLGADQTIDACAGASIDLTTLYTTTGSIAEWYFNGSLFNSPAQATDAGVYSLIATAPSGCSDTALVTLNITAPPALGPDQAASFCSNASLDLTGLFATTGLTAQWSISAIPVADPTAIIGGGTYQLIAANAAGCADTALVTVSVDVAPVLEPDMMASACEGEGEDLVSYFTTAIGLDTEWTFGGETISAPTAVLEGGVYTLVATGANGCTDTANVQLTVSQPPVLGTDVAIAVCAGAAVDLTSFFDVAPASTSWEIGGDPVPDPEAVWDPGNYLLTAINSDGCASTATVTITHDPAPALGPDQQVALCQGAMADLTQVLPSTEITNTWTLNGAPVPDPANVDEAGTYQLVVANAIGCTDTATVHVVVNAVPSLGPDQIFTLCPWQTADLYNAFPVNGMNANFFLNGDPVADPTAISDQGTYTVTVIDANGCVDTAAATVLAIECLCEADFTVNAGCMQDPAEFTLLADSAIISARWDFGDAAGSSAAIDPIVLFQREGEVLVSLEATLGCGVVRLERTITIEDCSDSCTVWIPSSFTPDGDGVNDSWSWIGECEPEDLSLLIYDRFGELIFSTNDPGASWDGNFKGVPSPLGVYTYRAGYRLPYQDRKEVSGSITLVR